MLLLRAFDSARLLVYASIGALAARTAAQFVPREAALFAFLLVGLVAVADFNLAGSEFRL